MLEQDDHADFSLDLALKDLDLAGAEAGPGILPVADAIAERWRSRKACPGMSTFLTEVRETLVPGSD